MIYLEKRETFWEKFRKNRNCEVKLRISKACYKLQKGDGFSLAETSHSALIRQISQEKRNLLAFPNSENTYIFPLKFNWQTSGVFPVEF